MTGVTVFWVGDNQQPEPPHESPRFDALPLEEVNPFLAVLESIPAVSLAGRACFWSLSLTDNLEKAVSLFLKEDIGALIYRFFPFDSCLAFRIVYLRLHLEP
jgi:hypothetical protein